MRSEISIQDRIDNLNIDSYQLLRDYTKSLIIIGELQATLVERDNYMTRLERLNDKLIGDTNEKL